MILDNKIILGDCLNELKKLEDNSIDCLLTDPPYGTNDKYGKSIKRGNSLTSFNVIDWDDRGIPTGFLEETYRVMKDDTWGFIFTDRKEITTIWNVLEKYGFKPRNTFYWIKTNKAPTPRKNFKSSVESAVVFTKGRTNLKWRGGANQNNFIQLPFVSGKEKFDHPTQKPIKLCSHLIELVTDEGDTVLDPFVGSGTTCASAKLINRKYIGMEIDKDYFDMAVSRLDSIQPPVVTNSFF